MPHSDAVDDLFGRALDRPPTERPEFVAREAAGDAELEREVLRLLEAAARPSPIDRALGAAAGSVLDDVERGRFRRGRLEGEVLGHYRIGPLRGEGGMAEVYEGERVDGAFERRVAVKVLRADLSTEEDRERFHRERHILAGLSTPHVAAVHDGGITPDGRPYVVLEWIEGATITEHCDARGLPPEDRLRLVLQVCDGLRHAHRRGILHRDVKPSNLLVERRESGADRAVVVDFGIAKTTDQARLTITGQALGTPGYMPPEQARGDFAVLGPAADVFSVGAVLYELLCGAPLHPGRSTGEVLARAIAGEVVPPRRHRPSISRDLETLLLVALDPRPEKRYPSMAALAEDLERFLAGEPLAVRRPGPLDRLGRRMRRSPVASALLAAGATGVLAAVGLALEARWKAAAESEAARRLGQQIQRAESILRIAYGMPLHDVRPDHRRVRGLLAEIAGQLAEDPELAGPAHYALGRGELALGALEEARAHLETAHAAGYRPPELALSLGRTLAELHERNAPGARRIRDPVERLRELRRLEVELEEPALALMREGSAHADEAGVGSAAYVEGRIAFQEGDFDRARDRARSAAGRTPWFYEATALEGRAWMADGDRAKDRGEYAEAEIAYERAREALERALEVGRSDPGVHFLRCTQANRILDLRRETGALDDATFAATVAACERGLVADPDHYDLHWSLARVHWQLHSHHWRIGRDPLPAVLRMIDSSERAIAIRPDAPQALNLLGLGWLARGQATEIESREERELYLDRAREAFERTLTVDPGHRHAHNNLGLVFYRLADEAVAAGEDPREAGRKAIEAYRRQAERFPDYLFAYNNAIVVWQLLARAAIARGEDPEPVWDEAEASGRRALELNPNFGNALENLADTLIDRLRFRLERGESEPGPDLAEALALTERAIGINASYWSHHFSRARALRLQGLFEEARGLDGRASLDAADAGLAEAIRLNPEEPSARLESAHLDLDRVAIAEDPSERRRAVVAAHRALDRLRRERPGLDGLAALDERAAALGVETARGSGTSPDDPTLRSGG